MGEPTEEEANKSIKILKPGGHCILIPEDIGYKGVINLERTGFEVRDAIFVAEEPDSFYYASKIVDPKEKQVLKHMILRLWV